MLEWMNIRPDGRCMTRQEFVGSICGLLFEFYIAVMVFEYLGFLHVRSVRGMISSKYMKVHYHGYTYFERNELGCCGYVEACRTPLKEREGQKRTMKASSKRR